ncbi:hypothetical protein GCM10009530_76370 [Microbispora corallina]|uniref:Ester cyclase n=1 Tax=Microbispora corallina TaxID=83302 RepID=A0ABQ4GBQ8_9ACTN|nr:MULTISPECIES: ester cyclase [Microbispora]ETK35207.1 hypothetical protein MPTA5024_15400 [Microbispora sp. ATCC PTA-5024]GIH44503.1 hypothetical protein Mco01_75030 [Microbispora corallina]
MSDVLVALDRLRRAYNRHDLDALARCFGERGVVVAPDGVGEGGEEVASYYGTFFSAFPDTRVVIQSVVVSGDILVSEYTVTGTHKGPYLAPGGDVVEPTDRPIGFRVCSVSHVVNGLIASHRIFYDQLELVTQIRGYVCFDKPGDEGE